MGFWAGLALLTAVGFIAGFLWLRRVSAVDSGAELRRREEQLAETQQLAHLGSWEADLATGRVEASAGLYDILRLEAGSFVPTLANFEDLVHSRDRDAIDAVRARAAETGEGGSVDVRIRSGDDRPVWIHVRIEAVRAADGTIVGLRGTAQDISDRRDREEALRLSEERLRSVVDASPLAIVEFDAEQSVRLWNPAAEALYRWTREEVEGGPAPFAAADVEGVFDELFPRALAGEHLHNVEVVRRRKDGEALHVLVSMAPLRDAGGGIVGVTSAGIDVSHQRRLEDELSQAQKMDAIGRLAGGIAHDFNNILTVAVGYGELLLEELDPKSQVGQRVRAMHEAARRAAELTDQLLTFSRRQVVMGEPADLNETVASMRPILERIIGEHIELEFGLAEGLLRVAADRSQLEQLLLNLIVNARDAMPHGGALLITTDEARQGPASAVLRVADTGVGIDETARQRIFEPFFTTKAEGRGGTGLGLSIVYGIVRQHGGNLEVSSVPGSGTVLTISLPLLTPTCPATGVGPGTGLVAARAGTVLLVEDEATVRMLAREILELHGHVVIEAGDGPEALAAAAAHDGPIDVLLTDVVLPRMVGPVVAEQLLATGRDLQVVFMSGYAEERLTGVDVGDAWFVAKPFRPAELVAAVNAALVSRPAPKAGLPAAPTPEG